MLQYTKGWKSFRLQGLYTGSLPVYKFTSQTCTVFVLLQTVECSKMIQTFLLLSFFSTFRSWKAFPKWQSDLCPGVKSGFLECEAQRHSTDGTRMKPTHERP